MELQQFYPILTFSLQLIGEIHENLLEGTRGASLYPGEFRKFQNYIGTPGAALHEAIFVPSPPEMVITAMEELEKFFQNKDSIPPC